MTSPKSSSGKPSPTGGGNTPGGSGPGRSSSPITATNSNTRVAAGRIATAKKTAASRVEAPARATNSNTRVLTRGGVVAQPVLRNTDNPGMNSSRLRDAMVARLRKAGITDELVLSAMQAIPRHHFIDEALASRAYEDASLPIGHGQTISQPWIVARMIQAARANRTLTRVLEVGTGCGYQAAVLSGVAQEVYSIERIRALHDFARDHLRPLRLSRVRLALGDGMLGLPSAAPFDAIVVAAAGMAIPDALSEQLAIGGRLVAPEGTTEQRLILIERTGARNWKRSELESVRFVPLRPGVIW